MLKKIDKAQVFLEDHLHLFQCPVCSQAFESVNNHQVICRDGHQFDLSKKGTLFLLQKSMKSEYTRDMLLSRQRLAESGLWAPLLDKIQSLIKHPEGVLLDIGCGEGSHSAYLKKNGYKGPIISFDISKEGINLAAASHEDIFFLTADLARSPFASHQYDTLLNILSPSNYSEFDRLLKQGGQVIKVVPNPGYLKELRELQEESKQTYSNVQVVEKFEKHYTHVRKESVLYTFQLPEELVVDFVHMTPLGWHIKEDFDNIRTKLKEITVDLLILIGESEDSA